MNIIKISYALFLLLFFSFSIRLAQARDFIPYTIPGAKCGNGEKYKVFIQEGRSDRLLIEFMGGGVCWSEESCFIDPKAYLKPIPTASKFSMLTSDNNDNPYEHHTMLYFPYCTGDVHAGDHIAIYGGKRVYHYGHKNISLALKYLNDTGVLIFHQFNDVTVWGASAGAIGSLIHGKNIENYLNHHAKKTLISDSPGLHYGPTFWKKFPPQLMGDFTHAFLASGLIIDPNDGLVARKMKPVFLRYNNWQMGFLLATRDRVMSTKFGDIEPKEQEKLILGPEGLPAQAKGFDHVHIWLKKTYLHTFLILTSSSNEESSEGMKAIDFARKVYQQ